MPKRPNQSLYSRPLMGISDLIESRLSDMKHQCVEGIWKQNRWLFL